MVTNGTDLSELRPLLWDLNLSLEEASLLISDKNNSIKGVTAQDLYLKLLMSYSWYKLIDIFGIEFLKKNMIEVIVLNRLFPPELKKRYMYVRSTLLQ